jgi:hypothetical protein
MKPLNYPSRFGIDPASSKGAVAADLSVKVPMLRDVSVDKIGVDIAGNVTGFAISLGKAAHIINGDIGFEIDNDHLHAGGSADYAGQNVKLDWIEDFKTKDDITTRLSAKAVVNQSGFTALGIDLGDTVSGPVPVTATLTGHRGQLRHGDLTLDLTKNRVSVDLLGVDKPAGVPAVSTIATTFGPHAEVQRADLKMTGKALLVQGTATFNDSGALATLDLPVVKSGANDDFALSLTRGPGAAVKVTIKGHSLDGSGLAHQGSKPGKQAPREEKFKGPSQISVHLDRLALRDKIVMAPFNLEVSGIEDRLKALDLKAAFGTGASVIGKLEPAASGRKLTLTTADAGRLVHGLFGLDSIKDGKLDISIDFPGNGDAPNPGDGPDFTGKLVATDFRILHQPFLARLFAAGSLTGFIDLMSSKGIAIDKLTVPFKSKKGVINIREAHASGPAIGISADGFIDRPKNEIGLRGTLAPLYGINSVLGAIPVLGKVLTSHKGEGILGTTYSVSGNADEPDISVNPLSQSSSRAIPKAKTCRRRHRHTRSPCTGLQSPAEPLRRQSLMAKKALKSVF